MPAGRATIHRLARRHGVEAEAQFMLEIEHGWLVVTFATPQADLFAEIESVLDKMAETCRLEAR
ncbi:MAG: hypothetical protein QOJ25_3421 [Solirubrobacteraceae bacterium]|nr:hypothetical protein [Solirubrobacteraceae bacterium]